MHGTDKLEDKRKEVEIGKEEVKSAK